MIEVGNRGDSDMRERFGRAHDETQNAQDAPEERGLDVEARYVGESQFDYLVEVDTEKIVRALGPDFSLLAALPNRGVIVTSRATTPGYDFVSRYFAPNAGIDEDPVTGSSQCCLGPFWQERIGRSEFVAFQASPRGVRCECAWSPTGFT